MPSNIIALPDTRQVYQDNLATLVNRSSGQKFMVHDGKLTVVSGFLDRIYYFFFNGLEQSRVKKAIAKTLSKIDLKKSSENEIKLLFFQTLKPLSERVYSRRKLSGELISKLKGADGDENPLDTLAGKVDKVRFALKLGVDFQSVSEGNSGTYYGRDYTGKKLIVFKPFDEEGSSAKCPKLVGKIKNIFFAVFPFFRSHTNINREYAYLNEIGASSVDRFLRLAIVPHTRLETFQSERFEGNVEKKGSCQLYVKNAKMMQEVIGLPAFEHTSFLKRILQKIWLVLFGSTVKKQYAVQDLKKLAIIEFLTGNQDGHTNNQLVADKRLHAIDYGLAFPSAPPEQVFSTINQYHFAFLPGAKKTFTREDLALIAELNNLDSFFEQLADDMTDDDAIGFDSAQKQAMEERIEILKAVIAQGKSIEYLGKIKYACDFERARQELGLPLRS